MKKKVKKLVLAKETLRSLEESGSLMKVVGGSLRNTACEDCVSGFVTCPTFVRNCTATYLC